MNKDLSRTDFLHEARWGVFMHYLARVAGKREMTPEDITPAPWNQMVDDFDVEGLADQLVGCGAGYFIVTIGQNSGFFMSPNETYDDIVGYPESHCTDRDLVADLAEALDERGIHLLVYLPSGAPDRDPRAVEAFGWEKGPQKIGSRPPRGKADDGLPWGWHNPRLPDFQRKWQGVITEWSERWGDAIAGWWIDGCYFPSMYEHPDPPNWDSFISALRAGNPDAIVAFNPGVMLDLMVLVERQDYTAGEISEDFPPCRGRWIHGMQWHVLSYLGDMWGSGDEPRFDDDFVTGYTADAVEKGGVITWEIPPLKSGLIPEVFLEQLRAIGGAVEQIRK